MGFEKYVMKTLVNVYLLITIDLILLNFYRLISQTSLALMSFWSGKTMQGKVKENLAGQDSI